jgi:hypothetical protein
VLRAPAVYFVAPLGAASAFFLMCGLPLDTWLRLGAWFILGLGVYLFYGCSTAGHRLKIGRRSDSLRKRKGRG